MGKREEEDFYNTKNLSSGSVSLPERLENHIIVSQSYYMAKTFHPPTLFQAKGFRPSGVDILHPQCLCLQRDTEYTGAGGNVTADNSSLSLFRLIFTVPIFPCRGNPSC